MLVRTHTARRPVVLLFLFVAVLLASAVVKGQILEDLVLEPSDGAIGQEFGYSVAVADGLVAVGSPSDDEQGAASGSAYLFDAASGAELLKLLAGDGVAAAQLGYSIDLDDGIVAVGAPGASGNGVSSGAAYLFDAVTGVQLHKLIPLDAAGGDQFGSAVAISGGVVAVGSPRDDDNGVDSGSLYLFDASTGQQVDKLLPLDGGANNTFGEAVAMDGSIVVVGAHGHSHDGLLLFPGAAYVFDLSTGSQTAELRADDAQSWDFFGSAVAIDGEIVAVGAWSKSIVFDHSGAAYVFDAGSGSQIGPRIVPDDTRDRQHFGIAIAVEGDVVAVGAEGDLDTGFEAGAAYLFDALSGAEIAKLLASDASTFDRLGGSIAIDGETVAAGAVGGESEFGSAYLYGSVGTGCLELQVDNLVAGSEVTFTISGGSPGSPALTVWGDRAGETSIERGIFCTAFGIDGVEPGRALGGLDQVFDADGRVIFQLDIPDHLAGRSVLFQAAAGGTCPGTCMSNVVDTVIR